MPTSFNWLNRLLLTISFIGFYGCGEEDETDSSPSASEPTCTLMIQDETEATTGNGRTVTQDGVKKYSCFPGGASYPFVTIRLTAEGFTGEGAIDLATNESEPSIRYYTEEGKYYQSRDTSTSCTINFAGETNIGFSCLGMVGVNQSGDETFNVVQGTIAKSIEN